MIQINSQFKPEISCNRFLQVATAIADSAAESVSGQKSGAKVEPGTGLIHSLIGEKSVTERWLVR